MSLNQMSLPPLLVPSPSSSSSSPWSLDSRIQQARSLTDYHQLVKQCIRTRDLTNGRALHLRLLRSKLHVTTPVLPNLFMHLYSKCGCPDLARQVFDKMPQRDIASWSTIISCFSQNDDPVQSVALFLELLHDDAGLIPNNFTFSSVISACIALRLLRLGQQLHSLAIRIGLASDVAVGGSIANMYGTCGNGASMADSRKVFDGMVERNVVAWTLMITNYVEHGLAEEAMDLFEQMRIEGCEPNEITIIRMLSAAITLESLQLGRQLHCLAIRKGLASDVGIGGSIANMYRKCGGERSIADSRKVFDRMVERNVVVWSSMISHYVENGLTEDAVDLFRQMRIEGLEPNEFTITSMMSACIARGSLRLGHQLHSLIIRKGLASDVAVGVSIAKMYRVCGSGGSVADARKVFDKMVERNAFIWSLMITYYVENGLPWEATDLLEQMMIEGFEPDEITVTSMMSACIALGSLQLGQALHSLAIRSGLASDVALGGSIANMYATCGNGGSIADSRKVFDKMVERNVVVWSLMISNYVEHGLAENAMDLFEQMRTEGFEPDEITITSVISACIALGSFRLGQQLHSLAIRKGLVSNVAVGGSLAKMYRTCGRGGSIADYRKFSDGMVESSLSDISDTAG